MRLGVGLPVEPLVEVALVPRVEHHALAPVTWVGLGLGLGLGMALGLGLG